MYVACNKNAEVLEVEAVPRTISGKKVEIAVIEGAIEGAGALALRAAVTIGDTAEYARWFGRYGPEEATAVRGVLKAVNEALSEAPIRAICGNRGSRDGCEGSIYAWVLRDEAYVVTFCPNFFTLPAMFDYDPGDDPLENGTREGTIIHEVSHFKVVGDTDDLCYGRTPCAQMARRDPLSVIRNADSYQYYAEDIAYFLRHSSTWPVGRSGTRR